MPIKNMDDIEKERNEEVREEFKTKVVNDFEDIKNRLLEKFKESKEEKKEEESIVSKIITFLWKLGLFMLIFNLVLGNIWLIKYFIKSILGL